jgi:O2-independent ubiquinone biosynthesis accessory factor UbiT
MTASAGRSFTIPRFKLPGFVATIGRKMPQWPHALALTTALNAAIKMKLLPQESLELLEGRRFLVDVLDTGGHACFSYRGGLFRPLLMRIDAADFAAFDLVFSANLSAFLQLVTRQEDPDTLFFNRDLAIEGDTELGLVVKNMLDAIDWTKPPHLPGFASLGH